MLDKDEEIRVLRARINRAITRRNTALENANDNNQNMDKITYSRNEIKQARKNLKRKTTRNKLGVTIIRTKIEKE